MTFMDSHQNILDLFLCLQEADSGLCETVHPTMDPINDLPPYAFMAEVRSKPAASGFMVQLLSDYARIVK